VALESIFEAFESIFGVGYEFFGVFLLGLGRNEESRQRWFGQKWWVTAGLAVASDCRRRRGEGEEEEKEKKKTRGRSVHEG
jgi:hypothetical protein